MTETIQSKISGIVAEMKGIEAQLSTMSNWDDTVGEFMKFQFQHMKQELVKELLIELIRSGLDFKEINDLIATLMLYLSQQSKGEQLTPEIKISLKELKGLVAAA